MLLLDANMVKMNLIVLNKPRKEKDVYRNLLLLLQPSGLSWKRRSRIKWKNNKGQMKGTAIAEIVALHVQLGGDSDYSSRVMLGEEKGFNMDLFRGQRTNFAKLR